MLTAELLQAVQLRLQVQVQIVALDGQSLMIERPGLALAMAAGDGRPLGVATGGAAVCVAWVVGGSQDAHHRQQHQHHADALEDGRPAAHPRRSPWRAWSVIAGVAAPGFGGFAD